jgi:membrane-associated phospholipid phosphatase
MVETFIALVVTYYWQISVHSGIMAGAVVIAGLLFGAQVALILSPLILLVAAARLRLKRHTPWQVVAGIAVGMTAPPLLYALIAPRF